jgi:alpha-amylase
MNQVLLDLIKEYGSAFKVSFSISGTAMEQFRMHAPEVLESFQKLAATGCVEFIAETYSHSLSSLKSKEEFFKQIDMQKALVKEFFGQEPKTFRNTELIYSDGIGEMIAEKGFETMLTEGAKHVLGWKSPNFLYCNAINPKLKILLKNFRLSDDIAFRFSQHSWDQWPLTTEKYVDWLNEVDPAQETVNLFMDYETFGEHQWPETGIFEFMRALPGRVLSHSPFRFHTPSEVSQALQPVAAIHVPYPISWADEERDLTAWLGNDLQDDAFHRLYEIEEKVKFCNDPEIMNDWRFLQTSDHFYYMCTKWFSDGDVHKYFNPYNSPYEAYVNFMNILSDFMIRINERCPGAADIVTAEEPIKKTEKKQSTTKKVVKKKAPAVKKVAVKSAKKKTVKAKPLAAASAEVDLSVVLNYSNTAMRKALKDQDAFTVGLALTDCSEKVRTHVISNLGIRVHQRLENMKISTEDLHPKVIERCRKKILSKLMNPDK